MKIEQVLFYYLGDDNNSTGILVDDKHIICGCCGSVFEVDDDEVFIIRRLPWTDISGVIRGGLVKNEHRT